LLAKYQELAQLPLRTNELLALLVCFVRDNIALFRKTLLFKGIDLRKKKRKKKYIIANEEAAMRILVAIIHFM